MSMGLYSREVVAAWLGKRVEEIERMIEEDDLPAVTCLVLFTGVIMVAVIAVTCAVVRAWPVIMSEVDGRAERERKMQREMAEEVAR